MALPRLSHLSFGEVGAPWWDDKPVAVIGTGPSLKGVDFAPFRQLTCHVFAVKESIWDLPNAECVFSLDRPWINRQADKLRQLTCGIYLAVEPESGALCQRIEGATYVIRSRFQGLSDDPTTIQSGGNSGAGALNIAYLKRAKRIVLFGYDYTVGHYCDERYYWQDPTHNERYWPNWGKDFVHSLPQLKAAGVEVLCASPTSNLDMFPKVTIEQGLQYLDRV